jgi:DNA-binding response OmpR family regulator
MSGRYCFDDVEIDMRASRLLKGGKALAIEPKALNLLAFLVKNRGRLVERRELIVLPLGLSRHGKGLSPRSGVGPRGVDGA